MTAKLHINIAQGVIDVEGDPDLVREIYADFKDQLHSRGMAHGHSHVEPDEAEDAEEAPKRRATTKRKALTRKRSKGDEAGPSVNVDAPRLDRDLDTSKLAAYYDQFSPKNHPEKILIFLSFLIDELGIQAPNTDQVYSCYIKADERPPRAFAQAFRDTSGKSFGYIDYRSGADIRITTAGTNHLKFDIKKKATE
jgi:hypothetical protein